MPARLGYRIDDFHLVPSVDAATKLLNFELVMDEEELRKHVDGLRESIADTAFAHKPTASKSTASTLRAKITLNWLARAIAGFEAYVLCPTGQLREQTKQTATKQLVAYISGLRGTAKAGQGYLLAEEKKVLLAITGEKRMPGLPNSPWKPKAIPLTTAQLFATPPRKRTFQEFSSDPIPAQQSLSAGSSSLSSSSSSSSPAPVLKRRKRGAGSRRNKAKTAA